MSGLLVTPKPLTSPFLSTIQDDYLKADSRNKSQNENPKNHAGAIKYNFASLN